MSYIYIASPYTHHDQAIMRQRFELAEAYVADQLNAGAHVYSPIVHCHALSEKFKMRTDFAFWINYNQAMLSKASELHVLDIPGWMDSKGVNGEIKFAKQCGIIVTVLNEIRGGD